MNNPMMPAQVISYISFPISGYTKQKQNASLRVTSPHHRSNQKWVWEPLPTSYLRNLENLCHPFLICFHNDTTWGPFVTLEAQLPSALPYFVAATNLHKVSVSVAKWQSHLPNNGILIRTKFLMPGPPDWIGSQMVFQLTNWNLTPSPRPPQRKLRCNFLKWWATLIRMENKER